ncbi:MAG: aminotransferase class III-fold pyridoxal phosphate-dependent enzyme [Armatimonadetes bacterium]|nr:aminotransferase class III-fold pyridoxal phosphate-dependent enzyme [Armatimonadota bacterium]
MNPTKSQEWTARLKKAIPWGSSTCSKAPRFAPEEPGVIVRGKGCRVWDADGREYIDYRNSLGPVTLGYGFPTVDNAIREQLDQGIIFGHPHPLEAEVAEMACQMIPCAEQARFLKTGGEAIAACIRLARFVTGRDHIIQIGYNGWLNSLASGGRLLPGQVAQSAPPGVPLCLSALHHACPWNDIQAVEETLNDYSGQVAAVVSAAGYADMEKGRTFLPALRELTRKHDTLLIYDEIVTGFRIAVGGAQEYFDAVPDLAVFGKGIANGMPLAAYVGKREVMEQMEKVPISSTFGGDTLSLAASKAALSAYRNRDVIGHLWRQGETLWAGANNMFRSKGLPIEAQGFWPCPQIVFLTDAPEGLYERFYRAAYRNGVSLYDVSYVNFSHQDKDIAETLERLEKACGEVWKV